MSSCIAGPPRLLTSNAWLHCRCCCCILPSAVVCQLCIADARHLSALNNLVLLWHLPLATNTCAWPCTIYLPIFRGLLTSDTACCASTQVLAAAGHKLLLSLPSACLSPSASRQEGHIGAIFRHLLEDPITLEAWMESEIKNSMSVKGVRDPYPHARSFNQANPLSRWDCLLAFVTYWLVVQ